MARSERRLLYLSPEVDALIRERALARDVSMNEWLNLAIKHALSGAHAVEITETTITQTKADL